MMNKLNTPTEKAPADTNFDCEKNLARLIPPGIHAMLKANSPEVLQQHRHMLHLAVTEADALASQTAFPQLFFPALAQEKTEAIVAWSRRQKSIRTSATASVFAN